MEMKLAPKEEAESPEGVVYLHERAMENLGFIRDTLERSTPFTSVSGWGLVGMGLYSIIWGCVAS